ncbi:hypothetical protein BG004_007976 [Podila humilis]|nr:hypothetical protein BG004_007976 [Podila humilis]
MSISTFLPQLAQGFEALETLFAEIGSPPEECEAQRNDLWDKILLLLDQRIELVREQKAHLQNGCDTLIVNIRQLADQVGQSQQVVDVVIEQSMDKSLWDRYHELETQHNTITDHYQARLKDIQGLYKDLVSYIPILGPSFVQAGSCPENGGKVSFEAEESYREQIARCKKEQARRIQVVETAVVTIRHLWTELGWTAQDEFDHNVINADTARLPLTDETIRRLESKQSMLEDERAQRGAILQKRMADITRLWEKLRIDEEEREEFMSMHLGLSSDTIQSYKDELARLEELKSEKLADLILDERKLLIKLWEQMFYTEEQRESFTPFYSSDTSEAILTAHEEEVSRLKDELESNTELFELTTRLVQSLHEIQEFQASSKDSNRLFKAEPGRLLREEKFRKSMRREVPRMATQLEAYLKEYEITYGAPFLVYGERFLDTMWSKVNGAWETPGKSNESEEPPNSPRSRRISPQDEPATPRTPSKRVGYSTSGPGTPSKVRTFTMPTTPSRSKSSSVQPESRIFSPTRPLTPSRIQNHPRHQTTPKVDGSARENSVISIYSVTTTSNPFEEPGTPTRVRSMTMLDDSSTTLVDYTHEDEHETLAKPRNLGKILRQLKRPAEEPLISPASSVRGRKDTTSNTLSPDSSPMHRSLSQPASSRGPRSSRDMVRPNLGERYSIVTINSDYGEIDEHPEDDNNDDGNEDEEMNESSIVEITRSDMPVVQAKGKSIKRTKQARPVHMVEMPGDEEVIAEVVNDDDGWETE